MHARGMVRPRWVLLAIAILLPVWPARGHAEERRRNRREPHAGFVFPAGARVGTTVRVNVGGQFLRSVEGVVFSGQGVRGRVVYWIPPPPNLDGKVQRELRRQLNRLRAAKQPTTGPRAQRRRGTKREDGKAEDAVELPDHPLLKDLPSKTLEELQEIERYFFQRRNPLQRKRSIEETVKLDITVAPDAEPGIRDLRLVTRAGLSPPLRFRVDVLPETKEREPNDPGARPGPLLDLPIVVNGQILPDDVDRFRFQAHAGQQLVMRAEARGLIPYQADSVPGWMQATLTLYDGSGQEVAFADEYRFDPDPVLFYAVPADGEYVLEVRDAIARGREDFVYRVALGELPFVTRIFPLGGRAGTLTRVEVEGWNLRQTSLPLDTRGAGGVLRRTGWRKRVALTNEVSYEVGSLPEATEVEPNDDGRQGQPLELPLVMNGRIEQPGDVDVFTFEGRTGQEVVVEVRARALGSPLDAVVRLVDPKGAVIAWNDDNRAEGLGVRGLGLQTHHADAWLRARLPRSGTYAVRLWDVRRHGGPGHAYRLRISEPRPDAELFVTPSSLNLAAGRTEPITVYALRRDGFEGDIDVVLDGAPEGFALGGGRIPKGREMVTMTLTAPMNARAAPATLQLAGRFRLGRQEILRAVIPADNVMQAFLWRHLVPARELSVSVTGNGRWVPVATLMEDGPVKIPRGGKARIRFRTSRKIPVETLDLDLIGAPKGLSVDGVEATHDGIVVILRADKDAERSASVDNLLIEVFGRKPVPRQEKKRTRSKETARPRWSVGVLPAVPYLIRR